MAFRIKTVPRKNPQDPNASPKYYGDVVPNGKRTFKDLANRVAGHTTMSEADVYGVLIGLEQEIVYMLKDGAAVELGELCIFYPSVQSEGADTEAAFNANTHIKKKGIRIRPKQSLSRKMADVAVEKIG